MAETYDPREHAGSRWKNSRIGTCEHCGRPISHGLYGNPYQRKVPPCLVAPTAGRRAAALPRRA